MRPDPSLHTLARKTPSATDASPHIDSEQVKQKIVDLLRQIYDPELPVNIYDLGLIYDIRVEHLAAEIVMTLTTPNCPVADSLPNKVGEAVQGLDEIDECRVELTWDPPWSADRLSDEVRLELGLL